MTRPAQPGLATPARRGPRPTAVSGGQARAGFRCAQQVLIRPPRPARKRSRRSPGGTFPETHQTICTMWIEITMIEIGLSTTTLATPHNRSGVSQRTSTRPDRLPPDGVVQTGDLVRWSGVDPLEPVLRRRLRGDDPSRDHGGLRIRLSEPMRRSARHLVANKARSLAAPPKVFDALRRPPDQATTSDLALISGTYGLHVFEESCPDAWAQLQAAYLSA